MVRDIPFNSPIEPPEPFNGPLGPVEEYVLSFEGYSFIISRWSEGKIALDTGHELIVIPLPVIEALSRLDLEGLVAKRN